MAAIGTIRKQSGLLIILIGMAMVLFLLGDFFSSGTSWFTQEDQNVGEIAGESISLQEYERRVQDAIDAQFGVEGASETAKRNLRERIWQEMVRERVLETQLEKLGISVSADEILDQVTNTQPGSILYQYFTDPQTGQVIEQFRDPQTGGLNSQRVLQAIQNLINSENSKDWLPIEQAIQKDIALNKYTTLLSKGLMISSVEAQQIAQEGASSATFSYALKEFMTMDGDEFKPSDEQLRAFFEAHKDEERFQTDEETRSIKMSLYEVNPTPEDIEMLRMELSELLPEFANDSNDTAYVLENAEGQMRSLIRYRSAEELPVGLKDTIQNAPLDAVFGPVAEGESLYIYKLIQKKSSPDSVRASHILIGVQDGDTAKISAAKAKLDSIRTVAEKNDNFAELAKEYSEDFGSAENGGDLDWFTRGRMVAPFEKAAFSNKTGDMVIVESQFGVHLIHITDQTEYKPQYLLAAVDRKIEPSKETADNAYQLASKFSIEHKTIESFDDPDGESIIETLEGIRLADQNLGPLENTREIVRWIFDAEKGDVSEPFETERFFAVIVVTDISEEGTMSFDQAQRLIYAEVVNELKAESIIKELGSPKSVQEAANKMGTEMKTANNINFSQGSLPGGLGRELKVLGTAYSLPEGQVSEPIKGNRGVFVIEVKSRNIPTEVEGVADTKKTESTNLASRVNSQVYNALQKEAGVKDNRARYY